MAFSSANSSQLNSSLGEKTEGSSGTLDRVSNNNNSNNNINLTTTNNGLCKLQKDVSDDGSGVAAIIANNTDNPILNAIESPGVERQRLSDAESLASINEAPQVEAQTQAQYPLERIESYESLPKQISPSKAYSPFSFPIIASLIPGSVFGVLLRLGILALMGYDEHSIFPLAWVQATGCLIMGLTLGLKDYISDFYGPLYTAMATGFCGSVTTFSSWQIDVFLSWANSGHAHRDWFRDLIDGLSKTFFTLAISLAATNLGIHLSKQLISFLNLSPTSSSTSTTSLKKPIKINFAPPLFRYSFSTLSVLIYAATLPAYFKASPSFRHQATAALLFSFPGTLTRYFLSVKLTPLLKLFPLGTFVANSLGTTLLGIFHVLQRTKTLPSPNACAILQGLIDGYCGCLTTVSTFAVEVSALGTRKAWLYVWISWAASQILLLVVLGTAWWGENINESRMCTYTS